MSSKAGGAGVVTFSIDGQDAGQVEVPDTSGIGVRGGADVGGDQYSPVSESYEAPFEFEGVIHVIDVKITPKVKLPRAMTAEEASESG